MPILVGTRATPGAYAIRDFLSRNGYAFEWVDAGQPEAVRAVLGVAEVESSALPLCILPDRSRLASATVEQVAAGLGIVAAPALSEYDLTIIGAGPAGLAAAVNAASEGLAPQAKVAAACSRCRGCGRSSHCRCRLRRQPGGFPDGTSARGQLAVIGTRAIIDGEFRRGLDIGSEGHDPRSPAAGGAPRWELFGRGPGEVVRIQFAPGRITWTAHPPLSSGRPVTFVTDAEGALVRPIDFVPGYLIPDGEPAREAPGALGAGGPVFPGPDPRHLWVSSSTNDDRMVLVGMDGRRTGPSIAAPPQGSPVNASLSAIPDQTGYLFFPGIGGVYDVRPGGTSRVTTGTVLAVGPIRWLTAECYSRARCPAGRDRPVHRRAIPAQHSPPAQHPHQRRRPVHRRRDITRRGHRRRPRWIAAGKDRDHRPRLGRRTCASAPYRLVRS